jgi:hypothetical protein
MIGETILPRWGLLFRGLFEDANIMVFKSRVPLKLQERTMETDYEYDVFLSHSTKDKAVVRTPSQSNCGQTGLEFGSMNGCSRRATAY